MKQTYRIKKNRLYRQGSHGQVQVWGPRRNRWINHPKAKRHYFKLELATEEEVELLYNPERLSLIERIRLIFQ